jgi:hypothetical protein
MAPGTRRDTNRASARRSLPGFVEKITSPYARDALEAQMLSNKSATVLPFSEIMRF